MPQSCTRNQEEHPLQYTFQARVALALAGHCYILHWVVFLTVNDLYTVYLEEHRL